MRTVLGWHLRIIFTCETGSQAPLQRRACGLTTLLRRECRWTLQTTSLKSKSFKDSSKVEDVPDEDGEQLQPPNPVDSRTCITLLIQEAGARLLRGTGGFMFVNKHIHHFSEMLRAKRGTRVVQNCVVRVQRLCVVLRLENNGVERTVLFLVCGVCVPNPRVSCGARARPQGSLRFCTFTWCQLRRML